MNIVVIGSPKGGVGKTFIAANLAWALAQLLRERRVLALDADPQNALRFHFPGFGRVVAGWATMAAEEAVLPISLGTEPAMPGLLPFGQVAPADQGSVLARLASDGSHLSRLLDRISQAGWTHLVCDTPPGWTPQKQAFIDRGAVELCVFTPDAASLALLPHVFGPSAEGVDGSASGAPGRHLVLNQVDWAVPSSARLARRVAQKYGDRLLGAICWDAVVAEALGEGQPLVRFAPNAQAALDVRSLAEAVLGLWPSAGASEAAVEVPALLREVL